MDLLNKTLNAMFTCAAMYFIYMGVLVLDDYLEPTDCVVEYLI